MRRENCSCTITSNSSARLGKLRASFILSVLFAEWPSSPQFLEVHLPPSFTRAAFLARWPLYSLSPPSGPTRLYRVALSLDGRTMGRPAQRNLLLCLQT